MATFTKILLAIGCVAWLYVQKIVIVEYLFGYGWWFLFRGIDFTAMQVCGLILLNVIEIGIVACSIFLMNRKRTPDFLKFFLFVVMLSPLAFDILDILHDKSCLKAWQNPVEKWWHFVISLPLWALIIERFLRYRKQFTAFDHVLIGAIYIAYHFIKKY